MSIAFLPWMRAKEPECKSRWIVILIPELSGLSLLRPNVIAGRFVILSEAKALSF
jgi:hypothetical protein